MSLRKPGEDSLWKTAKDIRKLVESGTLALPGLSSDGSRSRNDLSDSEKRILVQLRESALFKSYPPNVRIDRHMVRHILSAVTVHPISVCEAVARKVEGLFNEGRLDSRLRMKKVLTEGTADSTAKEHDGEEKGMYGLGDGADLKSKGGDIDKGVDQNKDIGEDPEGKPKGYMDEDDKGGEVPSKDIAPAAKDETEPLKVENACPQCDEEDCTCDLETEGMEDPDLDQEVIPEDDDSPSPEDPEEDSDEDDADPEQVEDGNDVDTPPADPQDLPKDVKEAIAILTRGKSKRFLERFARRLLRLGEDEGKVTDLGPINAKTDDPENHKPKGDVDLKEDDVATGKETKQVDDHPDYDKIEKVGGDIELNKGPADPKLSLERIEKSVIRIMKEAGIKIGSKRWVESYVKGFKLGLAARARRLVKEAEDPDLDAEVIPEDEDGPPPEVRAKIDAKADREESEGGPPPEIQAKIRARKEASKGPVPPSKGLPPKPANPARLAQGAPPKSPPPKMESKKNRRK